MQTVSNGDSRVRAKSTDRTRLRYNISCAIGTFSSLYYHHEVEGRKDRRPRAGVNNVHYKEHCARDWDDVQLSSTP